LVLAGVQFVTDVIVALGYFFASERWNFEASEFQNFSISALRHLGTSAYRHIINSSHHRIIISQVTPGGSEHHLGE